MPRGSIQLATTATLASSIQNFSSFASEKKNCWQSFLRKLKSFETFFFNYYHATSNKSIANLNTASFFFDQSDGVSRKGNRIQTGISQLKTRPIFSGNRKERLRTTNEVCVFILIDILKTSEPTNF